MDIEKYVSDLIEGKKRAPLLLFILYLLSKGFKWLVKLRHFLYKSHFLYSGKVKTPVISIGNITAGGTGKTPLVNQLVGHFLQEGKVGVITRGYRAQHTFKEPLPISAGNGPLYSSVISGDEPYFLAKENPKAHVWLGKNRLKAAKAMGKLPLDYLFLDDGMQSLELKRDIEIVVMDGNDLFGRNFFLPRGYLRDDPKELQKAHFIFVNHIHTWEEYKKAFNSLTPFTNARIIGMAVKGEKIEGYEKAGVFCGIGKPEHFFNTVRDLKIAIVDTLVLGDHKAASLEELKKFSLKSQSQGAEVLLCTEKDAVKIPYNVKLSLPIKVVKISLEISQGKEHWDALCAKIKSLRIV